MKKKDHQVEMRYEKKWIYNKNNYYIFIKLMRSNFNFKHHYKIRF